MEITVADSFYVSNGTSVTLYAQWRERDNRITFDKADGENGTSYTTATYDRAMPKITKPTKSGYAFAGYYTEADGAGTQYYYYNGTSARNWDRTEDITLYARWVLSEYRDTSARDGEYSSGSLSTSWTGWGALDRFGVIPSWLPNTIPPTSFMALDYDLLKSLGCTTVYFNNSGSYDIWGTVQFQVRLYNATTGEELKLWDVYTSAHGEEFNRTYGCSIDLSKVSTGDQLVWQIKQKKEWVMWGGNFTISDRTLTVSVS